MSLRDQSDSQGTQPSMTKADADASNICNTEIAEIRHYHSLPHLLPLCNQHYCSRFLKLLSGSASNRRRLLRIVTQKSTAA
jgi:hypothetical protein